METVEILCREVEQKNADIFPDYPSWIQGCFACCELGVQGRTLFHRLARFNGKNSLEADERQFEECLRTSKHQVGLGTLFHLAAQNGVTIDWTQEAARRAEAPRHSGSPQLPQIPQSHKALPSVSQIAEQQEIVNTDDKYLVTHIDVTRLPEFVQQAISIANSDAQRDMLLLSTLSVVSAVMPKFVFYHGKPRHEYHANLMTMLVARAASGKGIMNWSRQLLMPIHNDLKLAYQCELKDYEDAVAADPKTDAKRPKRKLLFIPGNASASVFSQQLNDNGGTGIVMETEMDTISQTWSQEYGQYSDVLRRVFEHETISQRRRREDEYFEINNPQLTLLLSGTYGQVAPLIKNQENGLPSRLATYIVTDKQPFDVDVFDTDDGEEVEHPAAKVYRELSTRIMQLYRWQNAEFNADRQCHFCLTATQRQRIKRLFGGQYRAYMQQLGDAYDPTIKRMAVITKRIGMILTVLRMDFANQIPEKIYPCDEDFETMLLVANKLMLHAALLFDILPEPLNQKSGNRAESYQRLQFIESLPDEFQTADALQLLTVTGISKRTAELWIKAAIDEKVILRIRQGVYRKVAVERTADCASCGNCGTAESADDNEPEIF